MARQRSVIDQIAKLAKQDQAILTITAGSNTLRLPIEGKIITKGDFTWLSMPSVEGLYAANAGQLSKAGTGALADAEAAFFPERAAELEAKKAELAQFKELARKLGAKIIFEDGAAVKRTRAPKGQGKPKAPKREALKVGDKFTNNKNGILYTVEKFEGNRVHLKGADGDLKSDVNTGVFFARWKQV